VQQVRVLASYGKLQSLWIESASSGDLTGMVDRRVRTYGSRLLEYMRRRIYGDVSDSTYVLLASRLRFAYLPQKEMRWNTRCAEIWMYTRCSGVLRLMLMGRAFYGFGRYCSGVDRTI
jgi:hypothetical protein